MDRLTKSMTKEEAMKARMLLLQESQNGRCAHEVEILVMPRFKTPFKYAEGHFPMDEFVEEIKSILDVKDLKIGDRNQCNAGGYMWSPYLFNFAEMTILEEEIFLTILAEHMLPVEGMEVTTVGISRDGKEENYTMKNEWVVSALDNPDSEEVISQSKHVATDFKFAERYYYKTI